MGSLRLCAPILIATLCLAQAPIKVDVHLINVSFVVRDARGALVPNLTADDFEVFEDGVAQKISFFARSTDIPMTLGLVADVSGSQEHFLKQHQHDLENFLKSTLTERDRAFLVCFGNHLRLVSDYSSSPKQLTEALEDFDKGKRPHNYVLAGALGGFDKGKARRRDYDELGPPDEHRILGTAFYDAIVYPIKERLENVEQGNRALILFSDGEDNSSAHHLLDAIETAQSADVRIFAIRYTEIHHELNARNKYGISVMRRLGRETGGADFDARERDLSSHFKEIEEDLRASYELAYHSTNATRDDLFRKIQIRPKHEGLTVRAKTGYYAH